MWGPWSPPRGSRTAEPHCCRRARGRRRHCGRRRTSRRGWGRGGGKASCQPVTPLHTPTPSPEPGPPDVVTVGGALADEVVGLVQGLLPQVAGAIGFLGDHQHVLLEHQGPVTSCGPSSGSRLGEGPTPALLSHRPASSRIASHPVLDPGEAARLWVPPLVTQRGGQPLQPNRSSGTGCEEATGLRVLPSFSARHPCLLPGLLLQEGHSDQQGPQELVGVILAQGHPGPLKMGLEVPRCCCLSTGLRVACREQGTCPGRITSNGRMGGGQTPASNSPARATGPRAHARSQ